MHGAPATLLTSVPGTPERTLKSQILHSPILKGDRPSSHRNARREDSPTQSPARPRTSKANVLRKEELKCLEMVLQRSCRKEDRIAAYLRRAHHVEPAGQERIFCFDGPDEHIRKALLAMEPPWVENQMATSKIFHLKWTVTDCEEDYRYLQEGMLFNHFQKNRELTTKVGLTNNLRRFGCEGQADVDRFFPRSYDMSSASEVQDFVLDFRRCAALGVLKQHLRLAARAEDKRRMMEQMNMDVHAVDGSCYVCNVSVLRIAMKVMLHWLEDLDSSYFEDEERYGQRHHLFSQEWDALVCYSELSDAQLCGDVGERKRKQRGCYSASGVVVQTPGREASAGSRTENHQKWPEFYQHYWGDAPDGLREHVQEMLQLLETRWLQLPSQGPMNVWVVKPGSSSKGSGVICMDSLPEVLHHCKATSNRIVQKYIERPLLLFSGRKFDLRQWVLVRSFRPLKVYMFSSCYLRLCNEPYDLGDLDNRQRHISNWSVNKRGRHVSDGAVASLEEFQEVLEMMTGHRGYWKEELIPQLKTCIIQTLQAVEPNIVQRSESFEVYGFDFLIGEDLKPWLLEVNLSPACESRTPWMSEMLDRMATRLVELLLHGSLQADGREPDWQLICDEAVHLDEAASPLAEFQCGDMEGRTKEITGTMDLADTWGQKALNLMVLGKSVSRRYSRRLDHIWRRNEAQISIARHWRGYFWREQMRKERWRLAGVVFHRCRQRAWLHLLKFGLFQQRRGPASALIGVVCRSFLSRCELQQKRRSLHALCLQRLWRGHQGRRCAQQQRRWKRCLQLQRWWRSAKLRKRLVAKQRILRWWHGIFAHRSTCATKIQAQVRCWKALRRYAVLSHHVALPTRRLSLLLAAVRWRGWLDLCKVSDEATKLQKCWRGVLAKRRVQERWLLRESLGTWKAQVQILKTARLRLQRCWRGYRARQRCQQRRKALRLLQSALRRRLLCKQRRWRRAAILIQRRYRGIRCRRSFKYQLRMILTIQRGFRCWVARLRLVMLQRFAARKRRWLLEDAHRQHQGIIDSAKVALKNEEDKADNATTRSSATPSGTAPYEESEGGPDVSFSARSEKTADERDISIGLIEMSPRDDGVPFVRSSVGEETALMAASLVEAQELRQQVAAGASDYHQALAPVQSRKEKARCEEVEELPLLQQLQGMARTVDALMAKTVSATRCVTPTLAPAADLITGSALRAARRLRKGYDRPTMSSSLRTAQEVSTPRKALRKEAPLTAHDEEHLLRLAYTSPSRAGPSRLRGRNEGPWRLSNIEPEPWPGFHDRKG